MVELKYKRTHVPTGKTWVNEFNHCGIPGWKGMTNKEKLFYIGDLQRYIDQWNKMGIVDGKAMWSYELVVQSL